MERKHYYALKWHDPQGRYIWKNVFPSLIQTQACGAGPYFEVIVREPNNGEKPEYWGWKNNNLNAYSMIYPDKRLVQICSPDFFKNEKKIGLGNIIRLVIEQVREVK